MEEGAGPGARLGGLLTHRYHPTGQAPSRPQPARALEPLCAHLCTSVQGMLSAQQGHDSDQQEDGPLPVAHGDLAAMFFP